MHEESTYPSPFDFSPERFLSRNKKEAAQTMNEDIDDDTRALYDSEDLAINPDPARFAFGYGRR